MTADATTDSFLSIFERQQSSPKTSRPLAYYDHFRLLPDSFAETRPNSAVVFIRGFLRLCQITTLLPITTREVVNGTTIVTERASNLFNEVAALLAVQHFNARHSPIVQDLHDKLKDCDLYLTIDLRDTQLSPIEASRQMLQAVNLVHSLKHPLPIGLMGAIRSAVSQPLGILGGVHFLPQVSPTSTSSQLENRDIVPYFARTIPTNGGDAKALVNYLYYLGVRTFAVAFGREPYGTAYFSDLFKAAEALEMSIVGASYEVEDIRAGDLSSVERMISTLQDSQIRYFVGIFFDSNYKIILNRLHEEGLVGNAEKVWFFTDSLAFTGQSGFSLSATDAVDVNVSKALNGTGVVFIRVQANDALDNGVIEFMDNDESQNYFISRHAEKEIFDQFDLDGIEQRTSAFNTMVYDSTMSLGIAACQAKERFFTGPQLYDTLKGIEFEGASGMVAFDNVTGTRREDTVSFQIVNLVQNLATSINDEIRFTATTSVVIKPDGSKSVEDTIQIESEYIFWDGSSTPPQSLPTLEEDMNLISRGVQILGWTLAGIVMILSVGFLVWAVRSRKKPVVRASQPVFLCMLCMGTFIMATCIITLSLQEPVNDNALDKACMASPWLFSVGWVMSFSALFSKTYRLNMLFAHSREYRRVQIEAKHVLTPFVVLMTINIIILSIWTAVAPLHWTRVETSSVDMFGRPTESYGSCNEFTETAHYVLIPLLLTVNVVALVFATYQTYKSRNLPPTNYDESRYIAISFVSMLEAFCLAVPTLFLVQDIPAANFIVRTLVVTTVCLAILLPIFVPKYMNRNKALGKVKQRRSVQTSRAAASTPLSNVRSNSLSLSGVFQSRRSSDVAALSDSLATRDAPPSGTGDRSSLLVLDELSEERDSPIFEE